MSNTSKNDGYVKVLSTLKPVHNEYYVAESENIAYKTKDENGNDKTVSLQSHIDELSVGSDAINKIETELRTEIKELKDNNIGAHGEGEYSEIFNSYKEDDMSSIPKNKAHGRYSHAEGEGTTTDGEASHAEGYNTTARGNHSHSEGEGTTASGVNSHAEGYFCVTSGVGTSHAEGSGTEAWGGEGSHAEGYRTKSIGRSSHAEGYRTYAVGKNSHAEGENNSVGLNGFYCKVINIDDIEQTTTILICEEEIIVNDDGSETPTYSSLNASNWFNSGEIISLIIANKIYLNYATVISASPHLKIDKLPPDITEDLDSLNINMRIFSLNNNKCFTKSNLHDYYKINKYRVKNSEGEYIYIDVDEGDGAHVEGSYNIAIGNHSHAEGFQSISYGSNSHAEGTGTYTAGKNSHAEGSNNKIYETANSAHVEGNSNNTHGSYSHVEGYGHDAYGYCQHVEGSRSIRDEKFKYVHIVGNGNIPLYDENMPDNLNIYSPENINSRGESNAYALDWLGNGFFSGDVYVNSKYNENDEASGIKLATVEEVNALNDRLNRIKYYGNENIYPTDSKYFEFTLNEDESGYDITGNYFIDNNITDVVIPYEYNGKLVVSISGINISYGESGEIYPNYTVKTIIVPSTITQIPFGAFEYNNSLTTLILPDSITHIQDCAFSGCQITDFKFPKNLEYIGVSVLSGILDNEIYIPNTVTYVGDLITTESSILVIEKDSYVDNLIYEHNHSSIYDSPSETPDGIVFKYTKDFTVKSILKANEWINPGVISGYDKATYDLGTDGGTSRYLIYPSQTMDISVSLDALDCTQEQYDAFNDAQLVGAYSTNEVIAFGDVPKIDIPVILKVVMK